jgi:hypothetical protein
MSPDGLYETGISLVPKLKFFPSAKKVVSRRLFEQEIVDKMSRVGGPMGRRFINGKAAERHSEEEYDQDDNNPL